MNAIHFRLKSLIVAFFLTFGAKAQASAAFSLNSLLQIIDREHLSQLHEVLPFLPSEIREGFTLQFQGHGLQEASFENPRAIVFGDDAKFVATFNGHRSQGKYNSLEILQFSETESQFEIYTLDFPIQRNAYGKAIRPEKNPAACTKCHGLSPHPIWGRYNYWAGMYGSHDDHPTGMEASYLRDFMAAKDKSQRYRVLKPRAGSAMSPFSSDQIQTFSFRPNDELGSLFVRLSAITFAKKLSASAEGLRYLLLMSPLMYNCKHRLSEREQALLNERVWKSFQSMGFKGLPFSDEKSYETGNLVYLFDMTVSDWGLTAEKEPVDPYFLDRILLTMPNYVFANLKDAFFKRYPGLDASYVGVPFTNYLTNPRLVQTDLDRKIVVVNDALGVALKVKDGASCDLQLDWVRKEFLL